MANILGVPQDNEDMRVQRKSRKRKTILDEEGENEDDSVFERGGHMFKFQPVVPVKVERKNKRRRTEFLPVTNGGVGGGNYPVEIPKRTESKHFYPRKEFGDDRMEYHGDDYINPEESKRNVKRHQQQRADGLVHNEDLPKDKEVQIRGNLQAPKDRRMGQDIESPLQRNMRAKENGPMGVNGKKNKTKQLERNREQVFARKSKKEPSFGTPFENVGELPPVGDHLPKQESETRLLDVLKQSQNKNKNKVLEFDRNLRKDPESAAPKPDTLERRQSHILEKLRQLSTGQTGRFEKPNLEAGFGDIRKNVFKEVLEKSNVDGGNFGAATQRGLGDIGQRSNAFRKTLVGGQNQLKNNLRFQEPELRKDSQKQRHIDRDTLGRKWLENGRRGNQANLMNQEGLERDDLHRNRVQRDLEFRNDGQEQSKGRADHKFEQKGRDWLQKDKGHLDKVNNMKQPVNGRLNFPCI